MATTSPLNWERGRHLGSGSFGHVFYGFSSQGHSLAVKSSKLKQSLRKEKKILDQLVGCPEVLHCYGLDVSVVDGGNLRIYNLLLEYASEGSLSDWIRKRGQIQEKDVRRFTHMILRGLSYLHYRGYVHCDLKPANILVFPGKDGLNLKLADFGLTKEPDEEEDEEHRRKRPFRGTPVYMSPESVADGVIKPALDIWSLGCVVLEMLTGRRAWNLNLKGLYEKLAYEKESPAIADCVSEEGRDFMRKCFDLNPTKRWTADMLLNHPFVREEEEEGSLTVPDFISSVLWEFEP